MHSALFATRAGRPEKRQSLPLPGSAWASMMCLALGATVLPGHSVAAPQLSTLYTFQGGADGGSPRTETLLPGPNGSLYGSSRAGATGLAAVFQLSPSSNGGTPWSYTLLQSFTGDQNGGRPTGLLAGPNGTLFGEGATGGPTNPACSGGCGLVFQLSPPANGQANWTEAVLYAFQNGTDGAYPRDGLVADAQGNLFGTTVQSSKCQYGCGSVFELSPPTAGQTAWTMTTLYTFNHGRGGLYPAGKLLSDQAGGFYGITWGGGTDKSECYSLYIGCGTIYHLTPRKDPTASWKKTTLYEFTGYADGQTPFTELLLDASGNLLGLTNNGGLHPHCPRFDNTTPGGCGTVFKLTPPPGGQGAWTVSLPWQFTGKKDGNQPYGAGLSPFQGGYVTTTAGNGVRDFGTIDLLTPGAGGQPWSEQTLFRFTNDANGELPQSYLLNRDGIFYGLTYGGAGPTPYGTVFSLTP